MPNEAALARALAGRGPFKRVFIPADMEAAFTSHSASRSRQALWISVIAALFFYTGFTPFDGFAVPDLVGLALFLRLGVALPVGIGALLLLRADRLSLFSQQLVACFYHLLNVALLALLITLTDSPQALGFLIANYAALMILVIAMSLPMTLVFLLIVVVFALQALAIALGPLQVPMLQLHNLLAAVVFAGPALIARYKLENEHRRYFLLLQREQLRLQQLAEQRDLLSRLAALDPLTGLANRRGFMAGLAGDLERGGRGALVAIAMIDIDRFKGYNDYYGHPAGDEALKRVAEALASASRPAGRAGRLGGEEFAVAMVGVAVREIDTYAERFRGEVARLGIVHQKSEAGIVTISVGVACGAVERGDVKPLFDLSDRALYRAKAQGRNCVVVERLTRTEATYPGDARD